MRLATGDSATLEFTVTEDDTALALGSGEPRRCWPRRGCWPGARRPPARRVDGALADEQTSVGTRVQLEHVGASAVGAAVRVTATVAYVDGRLVRFEVVAEQAPDDKVVAHGEVTRVVVDRERFLARVAPGPTTVSGSEARTLHW